MKQSLEKWFLLACLCLAFLGLPVALGACGSAPSIQMGASFPAGGPNNPYTISVTQGTCTLWTVNLASGGKSWCASSMPPLHSGDHVRLSYGVLFQDFDVASLDPSQHVVTLENMPAVFQ